jgi:hypothetical protein
MMTSERSRYRYVTIKRPINNMSLVSAMLSFGYEISLAPSPFDLSLTGPS